LEEKDQRVRGPKTGQATSKAKKWVQYVASFLAGGDSGAGGGAY
jgi:hypothetical protein